MKHAFCACRIMRVWLESSRVEHALYSPERCLHLTCRRAWRATTQELEVIFLSLSSFSVSFYAYSPVALVNIFFALALAKRNELLYTAVCCTRAKRTHGHVWSRTISHALTRADHIHHASRALRPEKRGKRKRPRLFSLFETNFRQRGTLQNFCSTSTRRLTNRAI